MTSSTVECAAGDGTAGPAPDLMTVRVRDRATEAAAWGSGLFSPIVRTVTIPRACPTCGARRGEPRNLNQYEDGARFSVDVWTNPCGHLDTYAAVLGEASSCAPAPAKSPA